MKLKIAFILGLFLISFSVYADSYGAVETHWASSAYSSNTSAIATCTPYATNNPSLNPITISGRLANGNYNCLSNGGYIDFVVPTYSCPGGGSRTGSSYPYTCTNAVACVSPQVRSTTTGLCEDPACVPPNFLNEFGVCGIPECPTYQVPNNTTGVCQTPPVCGSTEYYDNPTNTCKLSALNCPGHAHANPSNDACLPDPPLACPSGQHDDGTYTCVADDPEKCGKNQASGYINGQKQCISTPPLDTLQQEAADRAAAASAIANSNANPTDQGLANIANNQIGAAQVNGVGMSNNLLRSIASSANDSENREKGKQAMAGGDNCSEPPACAGDPIQCAILIETHKTHCRSMPDPVMNDEDANGNGTKIDGLFNAGMPADMGTSAFNGMQPVSTSFFNLGGSSCQSLPMGFKGFTFNFDPCQKFAIFRNLLGWFFYMWTAISIVQLGREKS